MIRLNRIVSFYEANSFIEQQRKLELEQKKKAEDEEKAPDEDYETIDKRFQEDIGTLQESLDTWKSHDGDLTAYFDTLHAEYVVLRDYISAYTFAIPAKLFSDYQKRFGTFMEQF